MYKFLKNRILKMQKTKYLPIERRKDDFDDSNDSITNKISFAINLNVHQRERGSI